jgi:hypothetical protein
MTFWINANKTKLLGVLIIIVSFIQADAGLVDLIGATAYAWTMRVCGLLALIFGFLNNPEKE